VDSGDQKLLFTAGKAGILWKLDRKTGKFLGYKEMVFQNVFDEIDKGVCGGGVAPVRTGFRITSAWSGPTVAVVRYSLRRDLPVSANLSLRRPGKD
jgi:hypothetical protein